MCWKTTLCLWHHNCTSHFSEAVTTGKQLIWSFIFQSELPNPIVLNWQFSGTWNHSRSIFSHLVVNRHCYWWYQKYLFILISISVTLVEMEFSLLIGALCLNVPDYFAPGLRHSGSLRAIAIEQHFESFSLSKSSQSAPASDCSSYACLNSLLWCLDASVFFQVISSQV